VRSLFLSLWGAELSALSLSLALFCSLPYPVDLVELQPNQIDLIGSSLTKLI